MDLQDRLDVTEVLARYGHVVDQGALDRLDTVFTADTVYDMSAVGLPVMEGIEALRDGALRLGAQNPVAHHVTDVVISPGEGDELNVESKGLMLTIDGALRSVTHHDVVRRTTDGWRIARRIILPQRSPLGGLVRGADAQKADLQ